MSPDLGWPRPRHLCAPPVFMPVNKQFSELVKTPNNPIRRCRDLAWTRKSMIDAPRNESRRVSRHCAGIMRFPTCIRNLVFCPRGQRGSQPLRCQQVETCNLCALRHARRVPLGHHVLDEPRIRTMLSTSRMAYACCASPSSANLNRPLGTVGPCTRREARAATPHALRGGPILCHRPPQVLAAFALLGVVLDRLVPMAIAQETVSYQCEYSSSCESFGARCG